MKLPNTTPSWKPVLKGNTYCSPACGAGCTKAAFDKATREAKELAEKLGPGWEPRVWENCAWHCSASKGGSGYNSGATVHGAREGLYWCSLWAGQQFTGESFDPVEAFDNALKQAREAITSAANAVLALEAK